MIHSMVSKLGTGSSYAEEQELREAAERGDIGEVARLIESGVSVNAKYVPDVSEVSRRKFVANRIAWTEQWHLVETRFYIEKFGRENRPTYIYI